MEQKMDKDELLDLLYQKVKYLEREVELLKQNRNSLSFSFPIFEYSYEEWLNVMSVTKEQILNILEHDKPDFVYGLKYFININMSKEMKMPFCVYKKNLYVLYKENDIKKWKKLDKEGDIFKKIIDNICIKLQKFLMSNKNIYGVDQFIYKLISLNTMKSELLKKCNTELIFKWLKQESTVFDEPY